MLESAALLEPIPSTEGKELSVRNQPQQAGRGNPSQDSSNGRAVQLSGVLVDTIQRAFQQVHTLMQQAVVLGDTDQRVVCSEGIGEIGEAVIPSYGG